MRLPRYWGNYAEAIYRKVEEGLFTQKRVLRLRSHMYWKVPWIETNTMIHWFLNEGLLREVRREKNWYAPPRYLDGEGEVLGAYWDIFENKREIYEEWVEASKKMGHFFEEVIREAFVEEDYATQKVVFKIPNAFFPDKTETIEIDAFCVKDEFHLGVEVKNIKSDVFVNPNILKKPSELFKKLIKEFEFCSRNRIVPILIAPLIDGSFYVYCDLHKGLQCRTLFQFFSEEYEDLCNRISEFLRYSHVKTISEATDHIKNWISEIPEKWKKRHGRW